MASQYHGLPSGQGHLPQVVVNLSPFRSPGFPGDLLFALHPSLTFNDTLSRIISGWEKRTRRALMFSCQAHSPRLLVFMALLYYLLSSPMQHTADSPLKATTENTPFRLQAATQIVQQDLICETTAQAYSSRARVIWEFWVGAASVVPGIAVVVGHTKNEQFADGIPSTRDFILPCMHDRDGKKR